MSAIILGIWLAFTPLGFDQLAQKDFDRQEIEIRGFLYQATDGRWLLAEEPNLKTCCVGASHQATRQVTLHGEGDSFPIGFAVTVQGILHHHPRYLADGSLKSLYEMHQPRILPTESQCIPCILILTFIAIAALFLNLYYKRDP